MASSVLKYDSHTISRTDYAEETTLVGKLNALGIGVWLFPLWGDGSLTDMPSGLNTDKTIVFIKSSADNYYNKIIIFSSAVIKVGYFASGTTLTWRTITTT